MADPARTPAAVEDGDVARTEWVRRMAALTVVPAAGCEVDEVADATAGAERLALQAWQLIVVGVVPADGCPEGCLLCTEGTCALVRDIIEAFPQAFSDAELTAETDPGRGLRDYRAALAGVGGAVFTCRRTLHASGYCLFGDAALDLCGRILVAAHRQSA